MHNVENRSAENSHPDELTFQEVLISFARIFLWIKIHYIRLFLVMIFCGAFLAFYAYKKTPTFSAELSFMLNDDNNPQISAVGSVLGQFGLPLSSGKYNVDKLLKIARSRRILEKALFSKITINGKDDFIANHYLQIYDLPSKWAKRDPSFSSFQFLDSDVLTFNDKENYALKSMYRIIMGSSDKDNSLFSTDYGRTDYIMSLITTTYSEPLSIAFTNTMYDEVAEFYTNKTIEKNQEIYNLIEEKRDSLFNLVQKVSYEIATKKDRISSSFRSTDNVDIANLQAQLIGLETQYVEVEKSLNHADVALKSSTPLIQLLDRPIAPLRPQTPSISLYAMIGVVIGLVLYLGALFCLQIIRVVESNS